MVLNNALQMKQRELFEWSIFGLFLLVTALVIAIG